jgi:hypothetical protein
MLEIPKDLYTPVIFIYKVKITSMIQWVISRKPIYVYTQRFLRDYT